MTQHPPHKENKSSYHEVLVIALRLVVVVKKQEKKKQTGKAENRKAEKQRVKKAKEKQRKEREKQTKYIKKAGRLKQQKKGAEKKINYQNRNFNEAKYITWAVLTLIIPDTNVQPPKGPKDLMSLNYLTDECC